jgi:hypothetical protein
LSRNRCWATSWKACRKGTCPDGLLGIKHLETCLLSITLLLQNQVMGILRNKDLFFGSHKQGDNTKGHLFEPDLLKACGFQYF